MYDLELTLEGTGIETLPNQIIERFSPDHVQYFDKVVIISKEKYYLRTTSNLISVLTLYYKEPNFCNLLIISGGGGTGIFGIDWGAEANMKNQLKDFLTEVASKNNWKIEEIIDPKKAEATVPHYRRHRQ